MNRQSVFALFSASRSLFCVFTILAGGGAWAGEVDESPLGIELVRAFPNLRFELPATIANANDGTDRLFVAGQKGLIHVFRNDESVTETETFLDMQESVNYFDNKNEEGLLGMAFHPNFKENGHFYLYYTAEPQLSVISRFTVSQENPNRADPDSEMELMRVKQPFWNHNGGTVEFGPDGYLYIALGDGGAANDPMMNGQNVQTLLGSILRIDVDNQGEKRKYGIPSDNPFANAGRLARPEIFAYGLRNVWRLSFDRKTGQLWAADVGQDIWEEINIIERGGNYGWDLREGRHKFGPTGSAPRADLIEPIWEYHHDVGKSITGGVVYRGKEVPSLYGYYLYADYVSGRVWALRYDESTKQVTENRAITSDSTEPAVKPIITFAETEAGEVYCSDRFGMLYKFRPSN